MAERGSVFGRWSWEGNVPVFRYAADHHTLDAATWDRTGFGLTRRHWVGLGNRRLQMLADNEGGVALFDEHHGLKWLTAFDPLGTGFSHLAEAEQPSWGSGYGQRPPGPPPIRSFGPTWFRVEAEHRGIRLERTILCPEGEQPWVLVRVAVTAPRDRAVRLIHTEEWAVRPRFLNVGAAMSLSTAGEDTLRANAQRHVRYEVALSPGRLNASEMRLGDPTVSLDAQWRLGDFKSTQLVFGPTTALVLEALGDQAARARTDGAPHPTLYLDTTLELDPGERRELWFRFGVDDASPCQRPDAVYAQSMATLALRLPSANSERAPQAAREIAWHAALLAGGACADGVLGGHTLGENSSYAFGVGVNGAARDPLQYALPLIYTEPDLALSVLRNTLAWGGPDGALPWGLDGAKVPRGLGQAYERPSDFGLWAMWLAAEYAAATGDLAAFEEPLGFHPAHNAATAPLREHLALQFDFLIREIGFGPNGHLRMRSCDWADGYMGGVDRTLLREVGESVLNSAMAAWVLPVWAGLADRLGDKARADEARRIGEALRLRVAAEWNGRWVNRARCGEVVVGEDTLFLEVQPWAILCGALDPAQTATLAGEIDRRLRRGSPLGARQHWPLAEAEPFPAGESLSGGVWFALVGVLIWALAKVDPDMAWDEWRRFSLSNHTATYPEIWEGTLSGPDAYNAPESTRPGRTWGACQTFPVNNPHAHAQPLLAYLRLLGVEPKPDGSLQAWGGDGAFRSASFELGSDGSGRVQALGPITVEGRHGVTCGGPGRVRW